MFRSFLCALAVCYSVSICSDPWGKDANLCKQAVKRCETPYKTCSLSILSDFASGLIQFHQEIISPADGPRSHFIPSSSQYTREAIVKYGFYVGFTMGCDRLMRENDEKWVYKTVKTASGKTMKLDPVP